MEVGKDTFIIIEYSVRLVDGSYLKGEEAPASLNFVVGYEQVLPALEHRLLGLEEGAEVDFVIPAAEAFGLPDPTKVHTRPFSDFPEGRNLIAGKWAMATSEQTEASYSYFVREKTDEAVVLDFNHPLAGEDLHYHVKVVRAREALKEELEYLRPCEFSEPQPATGGPSPA